VRVVAVAVLLLLAAAPAAAEQPEAPKSWWRGDDATGTWGGGRTWLGRHGVLIDLDYTAETFARVAGPGTGRRAHYRGTIDLYTTIDSGKLGAWKGGTLFVYGQSGHGGGVSPGIAADMPLSNLEAPDFIELAEAWYEQYLGDERITLRLGKQDSNRDFAAPRFPGNFLHSSYGALPTIPMPTFPAAGVGAAVLVDPTSWFGVRAAVYEGAPEIERLDTAFADGSFAIGQVMARHHLGCARPDAIEYTAGGWYHSTGDAYGVFAVVDALVPLTPGGKRAVGTSVRGAWAHGGDAFVGGALTFHPVRGNDTVGLGAGHLRGSETFVEAFYKARINKWWNVQPDVQIVFQPGGQDATALVLGLRVKLKL